MRSNESLRSWAEAHLLYRANSILGICEVLRLIYDEVEGTQQEEKVKKHLIDAMIMAKKMQDRLAYYKETYNDTTGHGGANLKRNPGSRQLDVVRRKRYDKQ